MLSIKTSLLLLFVLIIFSNLFAQEVKRYSLSNDFDFALYLIENRQSEDASVLWERNTQYDLTNPLSKDSLQYIKGWTYYSKKDLSRAVFSFDSVSDLSIFYPKSIFFSALSNAHLGNYKESMNTLNTFSDTSAKYQELIFFQKSGVALLQRDMESFDNYKNHFSFNNYHLTEQENELLAIRDRIVKHKKKSPWIAGISSAIIPGLGKIYAGQIGEGFASFITVGSFAAITAENWVKSGVTNWKTILFGTIGTLFYIGNIYGSVASVKIYYDEFNQQQNLSILYSIHIPLRTFFNN